MVKLRGQRLRCSALEYWLVAWLSLLASAGRKRLLDSGGRNEATVICQSLLGREEFEDVTRIALIPDDLTLTINIIEVFVKPINPTKVVGRIKEIAEGK